MAKYIDQQGQTVDVPLDVGVYAEAEKAGVSVESLINTRHPVREGEPSAFRQMSASLGLYVKEDRKNGIRATRLKDVMDGSCITSAAATNTGRNVPESRILMPATVLSTIEDKLARDMNTAAAAFDRLVAITDTIEGTEFKRAVINYDRPSSFRSQQVAQLAKPVNMLTLTVSERSQVIPTEALGIEWSDKLESSVGLDVVALSVARQVAVQRDEAANNNILNLLNGDEDLNMPALSSVITYLEASDLDSASTGGKLTHEAWVKWLYQGRSYRTIDWVITDLDGALAIERREGRPVVTGDNNTSPRITTEMIVANPLIPASVNVFVTDNPDWPAGTFLGLDSRYAVQRINSLSTNYQATAEDVIARSRTMRWDSGSAAVRLYDEAFSVLELK